jgi:hypothetical protein
MTIPEDGKSAFISVVKDDFDPIRDSKIIDAADSLYMKCRSNGGSDAEAACEGFRLLYGSNKKEAKNAMRSWRDKCKELSYDRDIAFQYDCARAKGLKDIPGLLENRDMTKNAEGYIEEIRNNPKALVTAAKHCLGVDVRASDIVGPYGNINEAGYRIVDAIRAKYGIARRHSDNLLPVMAAAQSQ